MGTRHSALICPAAAGCALASSEGRGVWGSHGHRSSRLRATHACTSSGRAACSGPVAAAPRAWGRAGAGRLAPGQLRMQPPALPPNLGTAPPTPAPGSALPAPCAPGPLGSALPAPALPAPWAPRSRPRPPPHTASHALPVQATPLGSVIPDPHPGQPAVTQMWALVPGAWSRWSGGCRAGAGSPVPGWLCSQFPP